MDPISKRRFAVARIWATIVASLLLLQTVFAGVAIAAADGASEARFGIVCAKASATDSNAQPPSSHGEHRHGLCCILHSGAIDAPPIPSSDWSHAQDRRAIVIVLAPQPSPVLRIEPKGAPQSPRAPPSGAGALS